MAGILKTKGFNRFKNFVFGVGASVVIIGALFKLMHWPFASELLILGMTVEAVIFAFSGIAPPEPTYYWEKVYPGLDVYDESMEAQSDKVGHQPIKSALAGGVSLSGELDKMMEAAKLDQNLVSRFGDNLRGFSENVSKMGAIADATVASNDFANSAKSAASALNGVKDSFASAADGMTKLASASGDASKYHEQVQAASKNLAALNAVYEMELQDTNNHLKSMNKFINSIGTAMSNLESSIADTDKFKNQMSGLATNLERLNSIYGNMLTAMKS